MADRLRMVQWLGFAAVLYAASMLVGFLGVEPGSQWALIQTLCWKLGNVTVAGYVGYKLDVHAFRKHITPYSNGQEQIRRAIIIAAAMLAVGMGL